MSNATVKKWGNSLAVRIPSDLAKNINIEDGSEVTISSDGQVLTISPILPKADDQQGLRNLFLRLRAQSKAGAGSDEDVFAEPMGDEVF